MPWSNNRKGKENLTQVKGRARKYTACFKLKKKIKLLLWSRIPRCYQTHSSHFQCTASTLQRETSLRSALRYQSQAAEGDGSKSISSPHTLLPPISFRLQLLFTAVHFLFQVSSAAKKKKERKESHMWQYKHCIRFSLAAAEDRRWILSGFMTNTYQLCAAAPCLLHLLCPGPVLTLGSLTEHKPNFSKRK